MLYRYNVILSVNPKVDNYKDIKSKLDQSALEFNPQSSSLQEMGIKEQLNFYINKYMPYNSDRDRMIELVDKL